MQSEILNRKKIIKNSEGEDIIDITSRSIIYSNDDPYIIDQFYVGEDMIMRPDLISYVAYGNTDNFDIILKFNAISNPFSIDKDEYILAPDLKFMENSMDNPKEEAKSNDIRQQYLDASKKPIKDPKEIEFMKDMEKLRKNTIGMNFSNYNLPPNLNEPGKTEVQKKTKDYVIL